MAARIPQMYEVRRAHPSSPPSPSAASPSASPFESNNPFATPNGSTTDLHAPVPDDRSSTNLSSVGGLLLSSSDWQEEHPKVQVRQGRARSNTIMHPDDAPSTYNANANANARDYDRANLQARIKSLEGELDDDHHRSYFSDASGPIAPARVGATPSAPPRGDSLRAASPGCMNFPAPTPQQFAISGSGSPAQRSQSPYGPPPSHSASPGPYAAPPSSNHYAPPPPQFQTPPLKVSGLPQSILHPKPQRPAVQVTLPVFAGAAPVSPMLAAPPRAHFSPMAPSPSPVAGDNVSIRGHDFLREKKAMFREGEEEVFTPFSPRARQAGPRTRANGNGRKSVYSTVDFWKRFSTVAKIQHDKESSFLAERKRTIWCNPMFVVPLILTLIAVTAIIVYVVLKVHDVKHV